jgi:hypothetical protein
MEREGPFHFASQTADVVLWTAKGVGNCSPKSRLIKANRVILARLVFPLCRILAGCGGDSLKVVLA